MLQIPLFHSDGETDAVEVFVKQGVHFSEWGNGAECAVEEAIGGVGWDVEVEVEGPGGAQEILVVFFWGVANGEDYLGVGAGFEDFFVEKYDGGVCCCLDML